MCFKNEIEDSIYSPIIKIVKNGKIIPKFLVTTVFFQKQCSKLNNILSYVIFVEIFCVTT